MLPEFVPFPKLPRLFRDIVVTEKIDGTNAQVFVDEDGSVYAGSRNRWITPEADNHGFAAWVAKNRDRLFETLGPGRHYGEWWGPGIQRGYGIANKRFSLFNVSRWRDLEDDDLACVPVLYEGAFNEYQIRACMVDLYTGGSKASPGFMRPEGVCIYHEASGRLFKYTLGGDGHKGLAV